MNILFLCGCYEEQHEAEVASNAKCLMEAASNKHQHRLIEGLRSQDCSVKVVSVPFIGAWPVRSRQLVFRGFQMPSKKQITYVPFHNLWGWRHFSRAHALRKPVDLFLAETQNQKRAIIVYAPHTPFLKAAVRAKRKAPDLPICLIVPDLPQYMNLNTRARGFYDFCKRFDIRMFERLNRNVDSFLLLTQPMADVLQVGKRPYLVLEGMVDSGSVQTPADRSQTFVYAGKLIQRFGIQRLLDAFALLKNPEYRLIICGDGELRSAVQAAAARDTRICYAGLLSQRELKAVYACSGVLVNPRTSEEAYTRYSFPSKILEYLQTGLPVVGNYLEGMPPIYQKLMYCAENNSVSALAKAMEQAMHTSAASEAARIQAVQEHFHLLNPNAAGKQLLAMIYGEAVQEEC